MIELGRQPIMVVCQATRGALERACAAGAALSGRDWRVLGAVVHQLTTYQRVADTISGSQLAEVAGIDRRHVVRSLARLEAAGVIDRERSRGGTPSVIAFRMKQWPASATVVAPANSGQHRPQSDAAEQWPAPATEHMFDRGQHRPQSTVAKAGHTPYKDQELGDTDVSPSADEIDRSTPPPATVERPRDPLWDALTVALDFEPATRSERGRWNAALLQLREAGATAEQIGRRARLYRRLHPRWELTATALAGHWGELATSSSGAPRHQAVDQDERPAATREQTSQALAKIRQQLKPPRPA
jgi:phage replication O-like protein O